MTLKRTIRRTVAAVTVLTVSLTGCLSSTSGGDNDGDTFTIVQYEDPTTAQGQGWQLALQIFKESTPM